MSKREALLSAVRRASEVLEEFALLLATRVSMPNSSPARRMLSFFIGSLSICWGGFCAKTVPQASSSTGIDLEALFT
jgi:hypothetical protein